MKALISHFVGRLVVLVRSLAPYAAIELLLPGGSMLALLYWWHRRRARQVRVIPKGGAELEVPPLSESPSAWIAVRPISEAMSRADVQPDVSRPIARGQPQATPLNCCRALAA
jgi:hypothetical protein